MQTDTPSSLPHTQGLPERSFRRRSRREEGLIRHERAWRNTRTPKLFELFPCASKEGVCVLGKPVSLCKTLNAHSQELCSLNHLSRYQLQPTVISTGVFPSLQSFNTPNVHCFCSEKLNPLLYCLFTHCSHTTVYLSQEPSPSSLDLFSAEQYFPAFAPLSRSFFCTSAFGLAAESGAPEQTQELGRTQVRQREQRGRCAGFFS